MEPSRHVSVAVDLARVRANAEDVCRRTGVPLIAVVKADAYGLGADRVAGVIGDLVAGFYVFDLVEAVRARLHERTRKPTLALHGDSLDPADWRAHHVRPAVWTAGRAAALRAARPVLAVDTGQQRFACERASVAAVAEAGACDEAFTHAGEVGQVADLLVILSAALAPAQYDAMRMHAAGTSLLGEPDAWLDAVRPGLALFRGAARVTTRLVDARDTRGPAGYTGFVSPTGRHGVIPAGYTNGLRAGTCVINGTRRSMPEVGMQSAFVELGPNDKAGDEVTLLGDGLTEADVAAAWGTTPHEALARLTGSGVRTYSA